MMMSHFNPTVAGEQEAPELFQDEFFEDEGEGDEGEGNEDEFFEDEFFEDDGEYEGEFDEAQASSRLAGRRERERRTPPLPISFVVPLGGAGGIAPALTFPVGGDNSPFAFALPLTGTSAPPAPAPQPSPLDLPVMPVYDAPLVVAEPNADALLETGESFDEWGAAHELSGMVVESEEAFGERVLLVADRLAGDAQAARWSSGRWLAALLAALGHAPSLSPLGSGSGHLPSASELYNAFVFGDPQRTSHSTPSRTLAQARQRSRSHYARSFVPLTLPGALLVGARLRRGDLVVRVARGEPWGRFSVVALPELNTSGDGRGRCVAVVESGSRPHRRDEYFLRRLTDSRDHLLPDTLILRLRHPMNPLPAEFGAPVEIAPVEVAPHAVVHPTLRRGARGEVVREAQTRLNTVHSRQVAATRPGLQGAPLAVDGIFGQQTFNAVVAFQRLAFPNQPREWDGVIGPKTWTKLHEMSVAPRPVVTVPADRRLTRAEIMRWFVGGEDSQGQPMGRVTSNNRAQFLIRGRSAFDAMARAIRSARGQGHFIYLLGWWMSDDFPVSGGATLRQLFTTASDAGVMVRAMLWDQVGTQNSNEVDRINALANGAAVLDNRTLNFGSHHQKILIVNGAEGLIAFCGGIDFNVDRIRTVSGDSSSSGSGGSSSSGGLGTPSHDVHCQIEGPAAFDLLQIFLQRWSDHPDHVPLDIRKGAPLTATSPAPLPNGREWVQIGRTYGNGNNHRGIDSERLRPRGYTFLRGRRGEQTVKRMILHAISQARQFIYLEEQYLVSLEIRDALIRALPNIQHLTILIPDGGISDLPQGNFRRREFIAPLRAAGGSKVRVFHPHPPRSPFGYVHSKMWVFDDEYAIIGSANCNRRGYTHDSEVIAGIVDQGNGEDLRFAHRLRMELWALHLDLPAASLVDGVASAAFWLRPLGAGRIERHDENAGIESVHTDTSWNNVLDPEGS